MPFTFAHPALLIPFNRVPGKWFSQTALVVGCMVPDFEYFLRMNLQSTYSHTFAGLFYFNVPLGLALLYGYSLWVRPALGRHLPAWVLRYTGSHFQGQTRCCFQSFYLLVTSLLLGAWSHLAWDAFTHSTGWAVRHFNLLTMDIQGFPLYKFLQHGSTLSGIGLIACWTLRQSNQNVVPDNPSSRPFWYTVLSVAVVLTVGRFLLFPQALLPGIILVSTIGAAFWALLLASILDKSLVKD